MDYIYSIIIWLCFLCDLCWQIFYILFSSDFYHHFVIISILMTLRIKIFPVYLVSFLIYLFRLKMLQLLKPINNPMRFHKQINHKIPFPLKPKPFPKLKQHWQSIQTCLNQLKIISLYQTFPIQPDNIILNHQFFYCLFIT